MVFKRMKDLFSYWYFQYLLATSVYMLEPTEQRIFNCFLIVVVAMFMYTSYVFIPEHVTNFMSFIMLYFDTNSPSESKVGT